MLTPYGASFWINVELTFFQNQSPSLFCAQNYYCFLKFRRISQLEQKLLHGNHFVYMTGTTTMETCPWNNNFAVWLYIFSLFGFFFFFFFLIIHVFSVKNHRHYTCKELLILSINFNLKCTCVHVGDFGKQTAQQRQCLFQWKENVIIVWMFLYF